MNNNSKRKNRPSGASRFSSDNRAPKGRPPAQGVYNNTYFMHAATALVGNVVQVRLRSGNIYEGVFRTFSPNFDVALELPFCIKSSKNAPDEGKSVPNYMIFPYDNVVSISAKDFDSQYATVGSTFQTDAAISEKCNGTRFDEKELEPWDPSGMNGDVDIELDGAANGWDPNEMFKKNENTFGVQSTFDDSLSDYTVQLSNKDSEEYKEAEMKAEKLAAEIENNPACRERLDLENGDEEALFAAVERPVTDVDRERECDRERERERERENDRSILEREQRERDREGVSERYITKPQRNMAGQSGVGVTIVPNVTPAASSQGPTAHTQRELINTERSERVLNSVPPPIGIGQSTSTQSPALISGGGGGVGGSGGGGGGGVKNSSSQSSNMSSQENNNSSNKYASVMKRKSMPQNNKLVRNTPPPNNQQSGSMSQGGGGGNNSSGSNQHSSKSNYQSTMQNSSSYVSNQSYSTMVHGPSQYRHQSSMGSTSKQQNGESNVNASKSMQQRNMRQYQSSSQTNYGDSQHQMQMNKSMHIQHGPPHGPPPPATTSGNNSSSPPLPSSGSHNNHPQQSPGAMHSSSGIMTGLPSQAPPQPQRLMRSRDAQLQDLRQFGQDFQLSGGNAAAAAHQQPQQQQQQQQSQPQQHIQMSKNICSGHNPQPAVSPSQQQQHVSQQQHAVMQLVSGTTQQHVPQHHVQAIQHQQQQQPHSQQHSQQHYVVQQSQQHVQQHMQQQQQQKQHQHHVENANMMHLSKGQQHGVLAAQQQQVQQQQMEQSLYHSAAMSAPPNPQQTSPVLLSSPGVVDNTQLQLQQQQHSHQQQQQQPTQQLQQQPPQMALTNITSTNNNNNNKSVIDITPVLNTNNNNNANAVCNTAIGEKITPPTTATVKKTHVLNPSAKPFTPRSPSTPNPSRPHTPQTPGPITGIYTTSSQLATSQTQIYAVMQQPAAFQTPMHPQAGQQPRLRRAPMAASQMHVSATTATGQPLLATGPIQPFIYHQQAAHPTHFPSQPYTPMPLQFLAQTPPSTTPSPGQPHQTFHPPPQPSPAGGGQPYAPQTQPPAYVMSYPVIHPSQLVPNHHYYQAAPQHPQQGQQFQIVMQQHPNQ